MSLIRLATGVDVTLAHEAEQARTPARLACRNQYPCECPQIPNGAAGRASRAGCFAPLLYISGELPADNLARLRRTGYQKTRMTGYQKR
jgi:hypothetical protein